MKQSLVLGKDCFAALLRNKMNLSRPFRPGGTHGGSQVVYGLDLWPPPSPRHDVTRKGGPSLCTRPSKAGLPSGAALRRFLLMR